MPDATERLLQAALSAGSCHFGQVAIGSDRNGFVLRHCDDEDRAGLPISQGAAAASEIAKFDDHGKYRPLKTAPNLCHGWQLQVGTLSELCTALDHFYPGRVGLLLAHRAGRLQVTSLRDTLNRQTGMYRAAARISDPEIDRVVFEVCRSDGGCLRTILWKRDAKGAQPSTKLPLEKFDPTQDQPMPLLCQESCALLIGACREAVKQQSGAATGGGDK